MPATKPKLNARLDFRNMHLQHTVVLARRLRSKNIPKGISCRNICVHSKRVWTNVFAYEIPSKRSSISSFVIDALSNNSTTWFSFEAKPVLHLIIFLVMNLLTLGFSNFDDQLPPGDAGKSVTCFGYSAVGSRLCGVCTVGNRKLHLTSLHVQ